MYSRPAAIFDLDGTLADITLRRKTLQKQPKNWDGFFAGIESDLPNRFVVELFKVLAQSKKYVMIVVTGRPERYRVASMQWLDRHGLSAEFIFMRKDGDRRDDYIIKEEILNHIRTLGLEVQFAVDDRKSVVEMWRRNGILCFQCDEGNF